jgi:hypothetical protein
MYSNQYPEIGGLFRQRDKRGTLPELTPDFLELTPDFLTPGFSFSGSGR